MSANPFDKQSSVPSLSFSTRDEFGQLQSKPVGTRLGGKVTKAPEIVQETGYEGVFKGKLLFWDSNGTGVKTDQATTADGRTNNPVNKIVVNVTTPPQGEEASLWIAYYPKDMFEAVQTALAGRAIEKGDDLFITITGKRPVPGKNPAHTYTADFTKGQGAFAPEQAATSTPAPPAPPAAAPAPPAPPAPPAASAEPVLSNGFTATQLAASGWSVEQIAALSTVVAPAPAAAPAPVASADDAAAARQAKIDAMSEEDRALLRV